MLNLEREQKAKYTLFLGVFFLICTLPLTTSLTYWQKHQEADRLEALLSDPVNEISKGYNLHQHSFQSYSLLDEITGVSCQGVELNRLVEYYFKEDKTGQMVLIPSFEEAKYLTELFTQPEYQWGPFLISQDALEDRLLQTKKNKPVFIFRDRLPEGFSLINPTTIFYGKNSLEPEHGDLKITYTCADIGQLTAIVQNIESTKLEQVNFHKILSDKKPVSGQIKQLVFQEKLSSVIVNMTQVIAILLMSAKVLLFYHRQYLSLVLRVTHNNLLILVLLGSLMFIPDNKLFEMEYFALLIAFFGLRSIARNQRFQS